MNCRDTTQLMNGYVDAELDLATSLAIEAHTRSCPRCRATEAGLRAVRQALRRHTECDTAPAALRDALRARYGARRPGERSRPRWLRAAGIAAMVTVLAGAGAWLVELPGHPPLRAAQHAKVVFHISQSEGATGALRNLANHLEAAPATRVVVVVHNNGVDFLKRGALDESGEPYEAAVRRLMARGVDFRVCQNTLVRKQFAARDFLPEATLVPSGVAEISRLQSEEGYAYMRL